MSDLTPLDAKVTSILRSARKSIARENRIMEQDGDGGFTALEMQYRELMTLLETLCPCAAITNLKKKHVRDRGYNI